MVHWKEAGAPEAGVENLGTVPNNSRNSCVSSFKVVQMFIIIIHGIPVIKNSMEASLVAFVVSNFIGIALAIERIPSHAECTGDLLTILDQLTLGYQRKEQKKRKFWSSYGLERAEFFTFAFLSNW